MATSKHVTMLLVVVLSGVPAAGQDRLAAPSPTSQPKLPNALSANCIVRITVDPAIMPLNQQTIEGLLQSSAVLVKAGREVLSLRQTEGLDMPLVKVEWLDPSSAAVPPGAGSLPQRLGYEDQAKRQLEEMYGREYMQVMRGAPEQAAALPRVPGESDIAYRTRVAQVRAVQAARSMQQKASEVSRMPGESATIKLHVHLPETAPPRAEEFLQAVIRNLQAALARAHEAYAADLRVWLNHAEDQRRAAETAADDAGEDSPATQRLRQHLDSEVDLSQLQSRMPLSEAVNILRRSVEPPLNIVVLWRDIAESPINMDGMPRTKLGTALDLLVRGLPSRDAKPLWRIKDDTVVIGTTATLGRSPEGVGQLRVETDAVNLAGQKSELTRKTQALELDLAGLDARQKAIQEQIAATKQMAKMRLAEDSVTRELEQLQHTSAINLANLKKAADAGRVAAPDLAKAEESAARIRIDLARRQEELTRLAGGSQLEEFTKELSRLAIDKAEKEAQLRIVSRQLEEVQGQLAEALTFDPEAARLRLAREALGITGRRVVELQTRLANLQPPMVTMIGAN